MWIAPISTADDRVPSQATTADEQSDSNPFELRAVNGTPPQRVKAAAVQARRRVPGRAVPTGSLRLEVQALLEDVVWGQEERSDDAERAWQRA